MAEFAIAVGVLGLVLVGMPIIGRYHELQLATIEGARQLAFRNSWLLEGGSYADVGAVRAALFSPPAGDGGPEIGSMDARLHVGAAPGRAGQAARAWLTPFRVAATSRFDLRDRALHDAELKVSVTSPRGLPEPFGGLQLDLSSHYELMGDSWASSGPAQVADRTGGLLVARASLALRPLLSFGRDILSLVEPAFREFCPGLVDPELVPTDRLGPVITHDGTQATGWRPAC